MTEVQSFAFQFCLLDMVESQVVVHRAPDPKDLGSNPAVRCSLFFYLVFPQKKTNLMLLRRVTEKSTKCVVTDTLDR